MFIIKWEKGLFEALGLHHALIAACAFLFLEIVGPYYTIAALFSLYYYLKEQRENGDEIEILDILTVTILSFSYAAYRTFMT